MCLSVFFAQLVGIYLVIVSLATLIRHRQFKKIVHEFIAIPPLVALSGSLSLLLGLLILVPHHVWVLEWPVIITIVGWITLLQGGVRLFFPKNFVHFTKRLVDSNGFLLCSWISLLIGLYLVWMGFTR